MKQLIPSVSEQDHVWGNPMANVEMVEYGDYECPYCGRAYPIVKMIKSEFGDSIRFVFRNFPLTKIHPHAFVAALAAEAASRQGKFWEMHDLVFENQRRLTEARINLLAEQLGLDPTRFQIDLQDPVLTEKVKSDFDSGIRSGVNRTPTFFFNGEKYDGEWDNEQLLEHLRTMVALFPVSPE